LTSTEDARRKAEAEQRVIEEFLPGYNWATGGAFRVYRLGQPPEPDILCRDERTGEEIGVEVGTAYYDESHATTVWGAPRGKRVSDYQLTAPDWVENIRILARAANIIRRKARKRYEAPGRLLLTVFTHSWRLYLCQEVKRVARLRIPKRHPFDEIHVLSWWGELYQLFPERRWMLPKT